MNTTCDVCHQEARITGASMRLPENVRHVWKVGGTAHIATMGLSSNGHTHNSPV